MWMLANIFYQFIPDQTKSYQNSIEVNLRTNQTIRTKSNAIALNSILLGILFSQLLNGISRKTSTD